MARGPGHTGHYVGLVLTQSGDSVTGVACSYDSGRRLYANAPVVGDYPDIRVSITPQAAAPCCPWFAGQSFVATMEDRGEIVERSGLRFRRYNEGAVCPAE
jgi:hypothetical protein